MATMTALNAVMVAFTAPKLGYHPDIAAGNPYSEWHSGGLTGSGLVSSFSMPVDVD
ncbi:hypothetical protein [Amycolatopsis sp. CA-230715]|uniref:hypothetical protein n=1 Tax=Amycolatopsis sp. CA-230715 TaxID=2745196 RepID=UPI001C016AB7|nr:hypothetical protein [Amycolatopsis sp. CA-230715]QWF82186.1 hypothetical protein HUW46_05623 [Amycolatopsis sp. CA-230715]